MNTIESITKTEEFIKSEFIKYPHFSFNDWTVMYNHSLLVKELALEIAESMECDKEVLAISALLHDVGKTYKADDEILHKEHQNFNLQVSKGFLESLELENEKLSKIKSIISYTSDSVEMKIIKDADAIALYKDKRLHMLFIKWAVSKKLDWAIQRKIDKFSHLNFEISREIGRPALEQMLKDWEEPQKMV